MTHEFPMAIYLRPLGPQGPKIDIEVENEEQLSKFSDGYQKLGDKKQDAKALVKLIDEIGLSKIEV